MALLTKRHVVWLVAIAALAAAVVGKVTLRAQGKQKGSGGPRAVLVTTHAVRPTTLHDTLPAVGTLEADERITVKNEVAGKVVHLGFEEGQRVEHGELLLQIRSDALQAQLEVKRRQIALLETQVARQKTVLQKGGISQQEFDVTANQLEVARAELEQIRAEIDKTFLRAPFAGMVGLRAVSPGAILTSGTAVAELVKLDPIKLTFSIPERYAHQISEGMSVRFRVHGAKTVHAASVYALEPSLEASSRTLRVRARAPNPDRTLRPGAFAQVRVLLERIDDALAVPTAAVVNSAGETVVWVNVDGEAEKRTVQTGIRTDARVQITAGLSPGDEVVTTGIQSLRPGVPLEVDRTADAMRVMEVGPDPDRPGMQNQRFPEDAFSESKSQAQGPKAKSKAEHDQ